MRADELRLHVGAHKTATTHLQRTLELHRGVLAGRGIDYLPTRELRSALAAERAGLGRLRGRASACRRAVERLRHEAPVLAISDENLLGGVGAAFACDPYARMEGIAGAFARGVVAKRTAIFLGIRAFDRFWASCYVEALRTGRPPDLDALGALARGAPTWLGVCRRLRRIWPTAQLTVWRYEDYNARRMASAFLGSDPGKLAPVGRQARRASPSAEGVRAAAAVDWRDKRRIAEIFAAHPAADGEPFSPFDAGETARLRAAYARDVEALLSSPDVSLLTPPGEGSAASPPA